MVNRFLFLLSICIWITNDIQAQSLNVSLLDKWSNSNLPRLNGYQIWSDLTGYTDTANGKEYIIAGSTDSIYFFDVSDPKAIQLIDVAFGANTKMVNRDFECFSHYVYCVSDNGMPGSLQIFDLQYLPDSVHKVYDSDSLGHNTHSIFIEAKSKRLYMCINRKKSGQVIAMEVLSLEDPEKPKSIGKLQIPTLGSGLPIFANVHEVFVKNDTAWCSAEYKGLWVFDMRDMEKQELLSVIANYPENGYNHSSWLSPNGKYLMFTDEVPMALAVKIFDVSQLSDPKLVSYFYTSENGTAHNAFWVGDFAYISAYQDGFVVFDLKNPAFPKEVGYYRTYPSRSTDSTYKVYNGCWGVYPWFNSGTIVVSDMQEGIFTLQPNKEISNLSENTELLEPLCYPNPVMDLCHIQLPVKVTSPLSVSFFDMQGRLLLQKMETKPTFDLNLSGIPAGTYFLQINTGKNQYHKKLIKL